MLRAAAQRYVHGILASRRERGILHARRKRVLYGIAE
jgi:hypothetical protein